ncbi:MAG: hypothetical protein F6K28_30835 [Microcoleus sp. SIO2G3]|nr:hypothetical protein [Microcoleus sp. SIO2G3]
MKSQFCLYFGSSDRFYTMPYYEYYDEEYNDFEEDEIYEPASAHFQPEDLEPDSRIVFDELIRLGVKEVRCHYNGGGDEGFAYFDEAISEGGAIGQLDLERQLFNTLLASRRFDVSWRNDYCSSAAERVRFYLEAFAGELATKLLGGSYGTGELSIRGAFTVNLETGAIADIQEP